MTSSHVISVLETQGRYANGQGQEYAMAYRVLYWREGMHKFREYRDSLGRMVRLWYIHELYYYSHNITDSTWKYGHIHCCQEYLESTNHCLSNQNCAVQQPF